MHTPTRVILVGMMGSGKSTVGRSLSAMTGWPYLDNDDIVVVDVRPSQRGGQGTADR